MLRHLCPWKNYIRCKLINLTEGVTVAGVAKVRDKEEKDNKESAADNEETQETPEENRGETE